MQQFLRVMGVLGSLLLALNARADNKYRDFKEVEDCGSAKIVEGDTCSNVKVQFQFDGCQTKAAPQLAARIICEKHTIKARFQEGEYRYEAMFEKKGDGWGGVKWLPMGGVKQYIKTAGNKSSATAMSTHKAPKPPAAENEHSPAPAPSEVSNKPEPQQDRAPSSESSPFKFSGFADIRYTNFTAEDSPTANTGPESGFGLEDAAFYANYTKDKVSVLLDVAFRRAKDVDIDSSATTPNQSSNGNFSFGVDKSQLYIKYAAHSMVNLYFGQFDTIFGVELNDSKDRVFGKAGMVYDYTLPVTHAGAMAEFSMSGMYVKAFAANPNNKGSFGSATNGDDKTEYGGAIGYSDSLIRGQIGYMSRPIRKVGSTKNGDRRLLDAIVGTTIGPFSLDLEYSMVTDPSKNTLTANGTDEEDPGTAFLALATYKFCDPFWIGVRYEQIKDDPTGASIDTGTSIGGSIHYKLHSDLELRTEYIDYQFDGLTAGTDWTEKRFNVAALFTF